MRQKIDLFHIFPGFLTPKGVHTQVFVITSSLKSWFLAFYGVMCKKLKRIERKNTPGPGIVFEEAKSEAPPPLSPITGGPNELKFGTDLSWVKLHGGSLDGFDSFTGSGAIDEKLENFYFIQISSKWPFILINTQEGVRILSSAGEPPCNSTQWRFMPNFSSIAPPVMGDRGGGCFGSSPPQIQFWDRVYWKH